jgi:hypothetical protein
MTESAQDPFKPVKADMAFSWLCPNCVTLNSVSWSHWLMSNVDECRNCEMGFKILEPWNHNKGITPFDFKRDESK